MTASDGAMVAGRLGADHHRERTRAWQNGETAPAVLPTCSTTATSSSPAGDYPSSCSGASDPNYTFTYVDGTVGVGSAVVTVTASSGSSTYGDDAPTITRDLLGLPARRDRAGHPGDL